MVDTLIVVVGGIDVDAKVVAWTCAGTCRTSIYVLFLMAGVLVLCAAYVGFTAFYGGFAPTTSVLSHPLSVPTTISANLTSSLIGPQVMNITLNITNDQFADNTYGYWALANYSRNIRAFAITSNSYYITISLNGTWRTFAGVKSPGSGTPEPKNGSGTFNVHYSFSIFGNLNTSVQLNGSLGRYNLNGSYKGIEGQVFQEQNASVASPFAWLDKYFGTNLAMRSSNNYSSVFTYRNQTYVILLYNISGNQKSYYNGDIIT